VNTHENQKGFQKKKTCEEPGIVPNGLRN